MYTLVCIPVVRGASTVCRTWRDVHVHVACGRGAPQPSVGLPLLSPSPPCALPLAHTQSLPLMRSDFMCSAGRHGSCFARSANPSGNYPPPAALCVSTRKEARFQVTDTRAVDTPHAPPDHAHSTAHNAVGRRPSRFPCTLPPTCALDRTERPPAADDSLVLSARTTSGEGRHCRRTRECRPLAPLRESRVQ